MNITAKKTSTLQGLQRQVNDATTIAAKAEAKYESYVNKAQLFQDLLTQATNDLAVVKGQWNLFLALKSSLHAVEETCDDASLVAGTTYKGVRKLIKKWEDVVQQTLEAADAINLASDYINKRKASNPLISNDLVSDATLAANNAAAAVKQVISALTAALNSLSASNQANNSTALTRLYIDMTASTLLNDPRAKQDGAEHLPLEVSLSNALKMASQKQTSVQNASSRANAEMAKAKEELDSANAKQVTAQAALRAAQAAVAA